MIANILNTIGSRLSMAIISLSLLLIYSNFLGAEGLGTIGLIILGISIFILICNFANGGGLVYYASRYSALQLLIASNAWTVLIALLFILGIYILPDFFGQYAWDILYLGILLSFSTSNANLLLGKERVKAYNRCFLIQSIIQIGGVVFFFFYLNDRSVDAFIRATYIAYTLNFLLSSMHLFPYLKNGEKASFSELSKDLIHYGFYLQLANLFQLFNYRLSYYLLQIYSGKAAVGIYTSGVQLSEGILLPSKSLGMVQYARISNMNDDQEAAQLTVSLMKLSFVLTLPILLILLFIPTSFFVDVLGSDFQESKLVIVAMSLGILTLSMEGILGRFFSGTGRQKVNTINTAIGLFFTIGFGLWLIPLHGAYGAAITASVSYSSMFLFIAYQLKSKTNLSLQSFLPGKKDWQLAKGLIKKTGA